MHNIFNNEGIKINISCVQNGRKTIIIELQTFIVLIKMCYILNALNQSQLIKFQLF